MDLDFDTTEKVYTLTTTQTNGDPNYVTSNHYVDLEAGATYYISANVQKVTGEDASIAVFLGTGPWNGEIHAITLDGKNASNSFTAPKTGRFYLDLEAEGDYGHTGGAVIKVCNLYICKVT